MGGGGRGGVSMDVNAMLRVGGDVGYGNLLIVLYKLIKDSSLYL